MASARAEYEKSKPMPTMRLPMRRKKKIDEGRADLEKKN